MTPYASQTSGPNRELLLRAGWGQFISPDTWAKNGPPVTFNALDNGAWGSFRRGEEWAEEPFLALTEALGPQSDFVVVPDKVGCGKTTMEMAERWVPQLVGLRLYLAVQDGMHWGDIEHLVPSIRGVFVGGSTPWKLETMADWGAGARARGLKMHVGRVNTAKRIRFCGDAGADSFDGSSASRFARKNLPRLNNEVRQGWLWKAQGG